MKKLMEAAAFAVLATANIITASAAALPLTVLFVAAGALLWTVADVLEVLA